MNRLTLALVAATTAAIAATGVMALSAVGDDERPATPTRADREKLQACLRTAGGDERRCKVDKGATPGVAPAELLACLRDHGLDPPTDPVELKMWILRTSAAKACIDVPKDVVKGPPDAADCGGGKPADPATEPAD
jgi:hypothetical protein